MVNQFDLWRQQVEEAKKQSDLLAKILEAVSSQRKPEKPPEPKPEPQKPAPPPWEEPKKHQVQARPGFAKRKK